MAKIEELTEILVNEIEDFNKGISKLEAISDKINTTKVSIDLREYKSIIESHQLKMIEVVDSQERFLNRFESLLKNAKVYPNWAVIVFIISLLISLSSLFYAYAVKQQINLSYNKANTKDKVESNDYIKSFFKSNLN